MATFSLHDVGRQVGLSKSYGYKLMSLGKSKALSSFSTDFTSNQKQMEKMPR